MKIKRIKFTLGLLILGVLILILLLEKHPDNFSFTREPSVVGSNALAHAKKSDFSSPQSTALVPTNEYQETSTPEDQRKESMIQRALLWRTPILYYGKVVDESNQPISGVQVTFNTSSVNEALTKEKYDTGTVTTDDRGIFKIDGVRGIGMVFHLSHPGYYPDPGNITDYDIRDYPKKGALPNNEMTALVFHMHTKGNPVPLIFHSGGFHAPNNGLIADFPLRGRTHAEILGQLQVQGWNSLRSGNYLYDWKVQLSVPNGGIVETTNYFDFIAPQTGYSASAVIEIAGRESVRKTYFIQLPAGYIRFKLEVIMGKDMFVTGDYDFNPDGSPNLEPSQEIKPTQ